MTFNVILGGALLAFIQTFSLLAPILLSFILIVLISLAINPMISRMRGFAQGTQVRPLSGSRIAATGVAASVLLAFLGLTGWAFFGPMSTSVTRLSVQLPVYWEGFQKRLIRMEQQAGRYEEKFQAEVAADLAHSAGEPATPDTPRVIVKVAPPPARIDAGSLRASLGEILRGVAGRFTALAFDAAQIVVVLVTVFFGVVFALMNPRPIFGAMFSLVPERHHDQALNIMRRIGKFVPGWAGATLLEMLAIGVLTFLCMWPVFGWMDALVLGLIAGVMESVPFLGPILSSVPALLLAAGQGGMTPLWVAAIYLVIQGFENNLLLPNILSRGMKVHPVAVIFSMLLCVAAFGVLGVLIAAPAVAIVTILHDELYRKRYLPSVTDADLDRLARRALSE